MASRLADLHGHDIRENQAFGHLYFSSEVGYNYETCTDTGLSPLVNLGRKCGK